MKQNNRLLNEEISKIKKMMSIKGGDVVSEQTTPAQDKIRGYIDAFFRAYSPLGTNINGIIAVINQIPDKLSFLKFITEFQKMKKKSFQSVINDEFEQDNSEDAVKIQQLLKSKFNIDVDPGLGGNPSLPARQRPFIKKFRITNYNTTPQQQSGYTQAMRDQDSAAIVTKTGPNPTDFVITKPGEPLPQEWKPEQKVNTASPQTFNDIVGGKGILRKGMTSNAVGELQQKLLSLGYSAIVKPTNYFGDSTDASVRDFQTKNSLTPDGKVGTNTAKKIDEKLASSGSVSGNTGSTEKSTGTPTGASTDTSTGIRLKPSDIATPERFKYNVQPSNVNFK